MKNYIKQDNRKFFFKENNKKKNWYTFSLHLLFYIQIPQMYIVCTYITYKYPSSIISKCIHRTYGIRNKRTSRRTFIYNMRIRKYRGAWYVTKSTRKLGIFGCIYLFLYILLVYIKYIHLKYIISRPIWV